MFAACITVKGSRFCALLRRAAASMLAPVDGHTTPFVHPLDIPRGPLVNRFSFDDDVVAAVRFACTCGVRIFLGSLVQVPTLLLSLIHI